MSHTIGIEAPEILDSLPTVNEQINTIKKILETVGKPDLTGFSKTVTLSLIKRYKKYTMEIEHVAFDLGETIEELKYRLSEEKTNFLTLRAYVRRDFAIVGLIRREAINDLSMRLGYLDPKKFREDFKSWTGIAPGKFREYHQTFLGELEDREKYKMDESEKQPAPK